MKLYRKKFVTSEPFISNEKNIKHLHFYLYQYIASFKNKR